MNNVMKQRLVGALILVALGIVFWPIIFVEQQTPVGGESMRVPPRPQIDTSPPPPPQDDVWQQMPAPQPAAPITDAELAAAEKFESGEPAQVPAEPEKNDPVVENNTPEEAEAPAPQVAALPKAGETRTEPPEAFELDKEGIPIAWSLQVVSVGDAARADKLRADLLAMGHKAYIKQVRSGGKALYRISIGPKGEKAPLEAMQKEIDAAFKVQSMVVRYYP